MVTWGDKFVIDILDDEKNKDKILINSEFYHKYVNN